VSKFALGRFVGCPACRTFLQKTLRHDVGGAPGLLRTGSSQDMPFFKDNIGKSYLVFLGASSPVVLNGRGSRCLSDSGCGSHYNGRSLRSLSQPGWLQLHSPAAECNETLMKLAARLYLECQSNPKQTYRWGKRIDFSPSLLTRLLIEQRSYNGLRKYPSVR